MTAYGTIEGAVEAVKLGAFDYIKKPVDLDEMKLLATAPGELAVAAGALLLPQAGPREVSLSGMLGESPAMRAVLDRARQVAALDETPRC
jgi:DNA-binding NtrC family response regulator